MKKLIATAVLATLPLGFAGAAFAVDEVNVTNGISAAGYPLAMHGADPVALLTSERVVTGSADHAVTHDGVSYYFASAENKAMFEANPAAYLPEHGGFCSYGVSVGKKFDGDPNQYVIHDGKLFLFLNKQTRQLFLDDLAKVRAVADDNWERIESIAVEDL